MLNSNENDIFSEKVIDNLPQNCIAQDKIDKKPKSNWEACRNPLHQIKCKIFDNS